MSTRSRQYVPDPDFRRIRNFLIETYSITQRPFNWTLERWDYCRYCLALPAYSRPATSRSASSGDVS